VRLAFVGQQAYFGYIALEQPAGGLEPRFFELRPNETGDELRAALDAYDPDVVIAFRPEFVPHGLFEGLRALTLGWLTEPLPRGPDPHPDLAQRLEYLRSIDPSNYDRVIAFEPKIVPAAADVVPIWRTVPLPCTDRLFAPARDASGPPRFLFTGRSTAHRDAFLNPIKHDFDVVHLAHGVTDARLAEFMAECDAGINLHNEPYPTFENRCGVYLAAGLLLISETLDPRCGLVPGVHYIECDAPWAMWELCAAVTRTPHAFRTIRLRGRAAAERFRASTVYPRVVADLLADVRINGSARTSPVTGTLETHER
jgi:hypothetical protein